MEIKRLDPGKRMSEAVVHNHVAYLAGQIPEDTSKGPLEQTREVLAAIDSVLAKLGTDKSRLLSATVYLSNIGNFAAMNEAWDAWVSPGNPPARATVEARLASPDILVEIVVTAPGPGSDRTRKQAPGLGFAGQKAAGSVGRCSHPRGLHGAAATIEAGQPVAAVDRFDPHQAAR